MLAAQGMLSRALGQGAKNFTAARQLPVEGKKKKPILGASVLVGS
jgi:hypothetical protein